MRAAVSASTSHREPRHHFTGHHSSSQVPTVTYLNWGRSCNFTDKLCHSCPHPRSSPSEISVGWFLLSFNTHYRFGVLVSRIILYWLALKLLFFSRVPQSFYLLFLVKSLYISSAFVYSKQSSPHTCPRSRFLPRLLSSPFVWIAGGLRCRVTQHT